MSSSTSRRASTATLAICGHGSSGNTLDHKVQRGDRTVPCLGEGPWIAFPSRELAERPPATNGSMGSPAVCHSTIATHVELDWVSRDLRSAADLTHGDRHRRVALDDNEVEAERRRVVPARSSNSHVQLIARARRAYAINCTWLFGASRRYDSTIAR